MTAKNTKRSRPTGPSCLPAMAEALEDRRMLASGFGWGLGWGYPNVLASANYCVTAANGDTYVAGLYRGKVNVAPSSQPAVYINSVNAEDDIFVAKYGANGSLLWAHGFGGPHYETVTSLILAPDGNVYMSGTYQNSITFVSKKPLVSRGKSDGYVVRMDPNTGVPLWSGSIGGELDDSITSVAVDKAGRVYLAGWIRRSGNLAPTGKPVNVSDRGVDDTFIERIDPTDGHSLWNKVFGENDTRETVMKMVADPSGGIIASGQFNNTVQFDRSSQKFTRTSTGNYDIYIADLAPDGNYRRVLQFGGQHEDGLSDMVIANGDLYFTGLIDKDINVSANPARRVNVGAQYDTSIYITHMKLDGTVLWTGEIGGDTGSSATALAVDAAGNVYVTGAFTSNTDFDPGPGTRFLDVDKDRAGVVPGQADSSDAYLLKLNKKGKVLSLDQFGGHDGSVAIYDIGVTNAGEAYLVGQYVRIIDINPGAAKRFPPATQRDDTAYVLIMSLLTGT